MTTIEGTEVTPPAPWARRSLKEEETMANQLRREGNFELLQTTEGHEILKLEGDTTHWSALVEGDRGELLVKTDHDHEWDQTKRQGQFFYVSFDGDEDFQDTPHLFVANTHGSYDEWILPNGLPDGQDERKKIVRTDHTVRRQKLAEHVDGI